MAYRFTPADRGAFKRCRRQWDFGARERRNYEPARPAAVPDLDLAVRDALAVYYFPGMWDWQRSVVLPLVLQGGRNGPTAAEGGSTPFPAVVLEAGFRDRGPERVEPGRLGAATWGMGRGAAPPRFDAR
ncbi:MAG TPA: hypothetical protein VFW32_00835 [Actinomycetes bacterium]|nr:hypothetical protein [Actinomycetes bacterium]